MYQSKQKWLGEGGRIRRRGIYWLPNLFTMAALFAGFFSIVQAMSGRFEQSALAIFVAMVLDGLDGRVARFTHTQSAFGAELDARFDGGALRYYVIPGPVPRAMERFTELTGRPFLPPRWALGYHQSRWGYCSSEEVRDLAVQLFEPFAFALNEKIKVHERL